MIKKLIVEEKEEKERLDKFLHQHFPEFSRSHLQKLIKEGFVLVNQKRKPVHHFLKTGDEIEIDLKKPKGIDLEPDKERQLNIIFKNNDFLVINKPAGLTVHPFPGCQEKTLVNQLLAYLPEIKNVGEDKLRPGIVHRLDKDVSGLMVVAKNQKTFFHLKKQFQAHKVKKVYITLVHGKINKEGGIIDFPIARSKKGKFVAKPKNEKGRKAKTFFKLIKYLKNYSLLEIKTYTGRTHQIRVHLKALGYPIVGDTLYKNKKIKEKIKLDHLFLQAERLGFFDLKNEWQEFKVNLPLELKEILTALENHKS